MILDIFQTDKTFKSNCTNIEEKNAYRRNIILRFFTYTFLLLMNTSDYLFKDVSFLSWISADLLSG